MKISKLILQRRSIRNFKKDLIDKDDLVKILEAARWAPSAENRQSTRYIVVTDENILKNIANNVKILFFKQRHAAQAPVIVVVCSSASTWIEEIGAGIQNMLLFAWSIGIGSCWIGAFNKNKIREIVEVPKGYKIYALILLGYPKSIPEPTPRLDLGKTAYLNKWKNPFVETKGGLLPKSGVASIVSRKMQDPQKDSPLLEKEDQ